MSSGEEVLKTLSDAGIRRIKLAATDIDGVLRGKYVSFEKFASAAGSHLGFCDVIFGWDIGDVLYDNVKYTGWHTGYPDAKARIDLDTMRPIPWEPETALFLIDFYRSDGSKLSISPRHVLERVLDRAASQGFGVKLAAEYEFWLFSENPQSLRDKNFRNLSPLSPGMFGYSVLRASQNSSLVLDIMDQLAAFNVALEGFHTETGPGVYEAAIAADEGVAAADKAALFKTAVKEIAARHGVIATFMAKWSSDLPGSSGHIHQSLISLDDHRNLFFECGSASRMMTQYIGGLCAYLPELMAMIGPTVNSYKRTVPGLWAPVNASWGIDNRTTAIRSIPGSPTSSRVELRLAAADMNPYLAMAASAAAGLEGVNRGLHPPPPATNAYDTKATPLPRDLAEAAQQFSASSVARDWFGDEFVDHYVCTRNWEMRQYQRAVTDWELARYFESV
jgi:glutamine synthetase